MAISANMEKSPGEVVDFGMDWSDWLALTPDGAVDAIATSDWDVSAGLTNVSEDMTTAKTAVWLSGGTAGRRYEVTNTITTTGGRTSDRSLFVFVKDPA